MIQTGDPETPACQPSVTALLADIDAYCRQTGIAATTFGQKAVKNWRLVDSLRSGGGVTLRTVDRVRAFMAAEREGAE